MQRIFLQSLTDSRFGSYYYTEEGKSVQGRIWREVIDEFAFGRMEEIIGSLRR